MVILSDVKTGHNIGISIMQLGTPSATSPVLGTDKQGTLPGASPTLTPRARLMHGAPSITYPIDNDPQETTVLGDRKIQKWTGALKIDGKIERWMIDSDLMGACLGKADFGTGGTNKYLIADEFVKFEICIYHMNDSSNITETTGVFAPSDGWSYKVTLKGVTLGNYDAPAEANARQKESCSYSAEEMVIEALA